MAEAISARSVYSSNAQYLENKLQQVKDSQGIIGKAWNGLKEMVNLGTQASKCDDMVKKFNSGEITFDEAVSYIEKFETKQKDATNLLSNIATGVGAIAVATTAVAGGPVGVGLAIAKGAPIGALVKTSVKTIDRATNNIDGDALDAKEITKDVISGAVAGASSAVSSGVGAGVKAGKFGMSVINGAKCSTICGAVGGATSYLADATLDEDKEFNFGDLAKNTATSAFVSGIVGAGVGGGIYGIQHVMGNAGKDVIKSTGRTIVADATASTSRKVLGDKVSNIV